MKKSLSLFAALLLLFSVSAFAEAAEMPAYQPVPDFTVTLISGETFTLSEVLTRKKAVLINLWATWCGPCEREFPYLQEAYEAYRDSVEVIALSVERGDSTEILTAYAQSHGLTFPVGSDTGVGLADRFVSRGIPTSVLVDRFGNTVLVEVGAQTSSYGFMAAFEQLTGDDSAVFRDPFRPIPRDRKPRPPWPRVLRKRKAPICASRSCRMKIHGRFSLPKRTESPASRPPTRMWTTAAPSSSFPLSPRRATRFLSVRRYPARKDTTVSAFS